MKVRILFTLIFAQVLVIAQTVGGGFDIVERFNLGSANVASVQDIYIGSDLDNDGQGEIILQIGRGSNSKVLIYEYTEGNYNLVWSRNLESPNYSSGNRPCHLISVIDSDNDGKKEIFVANNGTSPYRVYCFEMGSGGFSVNNPDTTSKGPDDGKYFNSATTICGIVTGDADGDGWGELYVAHVSNTISLEVWEATGNDSWTKVYSAGIGDGIVDLAGPENLTGSGNSMLAICEERGKLTVLNFSDLQNPTTMTVVNNISHDANLKGKITIFNLDNTDTPEIILANDTDYGLFVFEWDNVNSVFDRDKTDAPLFSFTSWISYLDCEDHDADGKGEVFYCVDNNVNYREFENNAGDFSDSCFSAEQEMFSSTQSATTVIRAARNRGNSLLDGDNLRDFAIGRSGNSYYDDFFILESNTPDNSLPVDLIDFGLTISADGIKLTWVTASEKENLGFRVYRSKNKGEFGLIADFMEFEGLKGRNGSEGNVYYWLDKEVEPGNTYHYLLSDVDYSGKESFHYDFRRSIKYEWIIPFKIFPNPFNPYLRIKAGSEVFGEDWSLQIIDLSGREVISLEDIATRGEVIWDGTSREGDLVPSGVYLLVLKNNGHIYQRKVTLIR